MARRWVIVTAALWGLSSGAYAGDRVSMRASADADPSDADLMFEALKHKESPNDAAAVDRLISAARHEARQKGEDRKLFASRFWHDPFADDPQKLIPVRQKDRELLVSARESARVRADSAAARAEAAATRAETARDKAERARAEAIAAHAEALAAKRAAEIAQARFTEVTQLNAPRASHASEFREARAVQHNTVSASGRARRRPARGGGPAAGEALARAGHRQPSDTPPQSPLVVAEPNSPPAGWTSADSRGIVIVPIDTPISIGGKKSR